MSATAEANATTVDPKEIEKFSKIAAEWWDPFGKFKPLHKFNPVRLAYIRDAACSHFARDRRSKLPLAGLRLLDVGCGGGLVAEPMRRLGADVLGIDASEQNIKVASHHAAEMKLSIDYRATTVEELAGALSGKVDAGFLSESTTNKKSSDRFDIVLNLEAVEHAADQRLFLERSAALVAPGGLMVVATINRTLKAFALAKIGAEYVLGWLPRGTHDPRKFVKPEEIAQSLASAGMTVTARAGVAYMPLLDIWRISEKTDVNYMVTAVKSA